MYNLVFSDDRSVRIRRHLLFWTAWCFYLMGTYLIPTNWIPAWNFRSPMTHIAKYGVTLSVLRILMAAILLTVVHAALVYGILYYFLPRYFSKHKNPVIITTLLLLFVCCIAFINYFNFVLSMYLSTRVGYFNKMPGIHFILPLLARQALFNYPSVVGFAVAIKLMKNWYVKQKEAAQIAREKLNAELQLLKAQVHPHFLFNTLNNIYSFILNDSPVALDALDKLSTLLNYIIYQCEQPLVPLDRELKMIRDYIDIQKIRYGESFNMHFRVQGNTKDKMITPLLLIPFLENSYKHGASQMLTHPWINLDISIEDNALHFHLSNNKPTSVADHGMANGLGLKNVKQRLALLYPGAYSLDIREDLMSFIVSLTIPLFGPDGNNTDPITQGQHYELV
jgi:sensor histidine kinase YesM